MTSFVRKNLVTINAKFVPPGYEPWNCQTNAPNPPPIQPTMAEAVLGFKNLSGANVSQTIPMTLGSDGVTWSCLWDSSAAGAGEVEWVVFASGAVQSANQGRFQILANRVNTF
jgi:hypothetical protein